MNWYEQNIEPEVRELVRELRNNGINTFCSCGHEKYVECETYDPSEELKTVYNVMDKLGIESYEAEIKATKDRVGYRTFMYITLTEPEKENTTKNE